MNARIGLPHGSMLFGFEIVEVLGIGGFGIAYLARDKVTRREFVIKEFFPSSIVTRERSGVVPISESSTQCFERARARFLEEARCLADLDHPNLVDIVQCVEAFGTAYIVMPRVQGITLADVIARHGRLGEAELLPVLQQLLSALEYVHARGLIHRDIKPQNILIRNDNTPVLIDFGAARSLLRPVATEFTIIYTPGFAPPEQYFADSPQGCSVDVYAICATAYAALTGKSPPDVVERLMLDRQGRPWRPHEHLLAEGVAPQVAQALAKGLELHHETRLPDIGALRNALNPEPPAPEAIDPGVSERRPVLEPVDWSTVISSRPRPLAERRSSAPRWWIAAGVLAVAATVYGGLRLSQRGDLQMKMPQTIPAPVVKLPDARQATSLLDEDDQLRPLRTAIAQARAGATLFVPSDLASLAIATQHGNAPAARRLNELGLQASNASNFHSAQSYFAAAADEDGADVEIQDNLSYAALMAGDFRSGASAAGRALRLLPRRATAWLNFALNLEMLGERDAAEGALSIALSTSRDPERTLAWVSDKVLPTLPKLARIVDYGRQRVGLASVR